MNLSKCSLKYGVESGVCVCVCVCMEVMVEGGRSVCRLYDPPEQSFLPGSWQRSPGSPWLWPAGL